MKFVRPYDEDTEKILEIAVDFLSQYFGYGREEALQLTNDFLQTYGDRYDEDFFHHEMSYRVAAVIHYLQGLHGSTATLKKWLIENGHNQPPRESFEYFRQKFYSREPSEQEE